MDWSNEPYVRFYTRDTTSWRMLNWEAQALFPSLMKILDRAGRLDLDGVSPVDAVCAALPKWPVELVEAGLASLRARDVIVVTDVAIVVPKFEQAQNTPRSDKARQAEVRARRRDEALGTARDSDGDSVTSRPAASRDVTPSHSPIAVPVPKLPTLSSAERDATAAAIDDIDPQDDPEVREVGTLVGEPTPAEVARCVELWAVEIAVRQTQVRSKHQGSASERVAACSLNIRTDEAARNLHREVRVRGIDGVLDVLEWAWGRFATSSWNGKQREEERKRIVFAFRGAATYWAGIVAERADTIAKAEAAEAAEKLRGDRDRADAEREAKVRGSPTETEAIDIDAVQKRLRRTAGA